MERYYKHFYLLQYLEPKDLVLTPLFIGLVFFIANTFKANFVGVGSPLQRYFIPALALKVVGAVSSGLVYQFYYHGGDTMDFYTSSSYIYSILFERPADVIALFTANMPADNPGLAAQYSFLPFIYDPPTWTIVRTATLAGFFAFDSYPVIAIYFSIFSLYSSWKFFRLLNELYPDPKMVKKFAYCLFYIPSVFFWGSGVFKDSLTLSGLFLSAYHIYQIVIKRKYSPSQFLWLFVGLYLMYSIRSFFLVILLPCIGFWFFGVFRDRLIKNKTLRSLSFPFLIGFSTMIIILGLSRVMNQSQDLSKNALKEKAEGFQSWHGSLGGSSYDLGMTDFSTASMIKVFPLAVNVSLFRPYVFEAHSAFQMIDALQSLFFLYFFLSTLYKAKAAFFTAISQDAMILFSITFSVFYSFVTGFTSYNFGALDRYKSPALPFFMIAMVLINYRYEQAKNA